MEAVEDLARPEGRLAIEESGEVLKVKVVGRSHVSTLRRVARVASKVGSRAE